MDIRFAQLVSLSAPIRTADADWARESGAVRSSPLSRCPGVSSQLSFDLIWT